jgi:thiamine pyrophosphate-dependent acetolactate synthase large subunit-like protein
LEAAAALLARSDRIVIFTGIGSLNAVTELKEIAQRLGAPVIKTLRAKELLPDEHPLGIGMLGLLGTRPAVQAVGHCDLLLMVGTDFPYEDFYPENVPAIQIDIEAAQIGHRFPVQIGLTGDSKATLRSLLDLVPPRTEQRFLTQYQSAMRRWLAELDDVEKELRYPIQPQRLARLAGANAPDSAIFCCDTGTVTYWAARNLRLRSGQRFTLSANLASMGYALPAAIGAQLAYPQRPAVALVGDGGLAMCLGELMTLAQYQLPVKVIVFNNRKLGLIQMEQEARGLPEYQTGLSEADFAGIARACGCNAVRVSDPRELQAAMQEMYASAGPYLLDVLVNPDELTAPPTIHWKHAYGYSLAKLKEFFGLGDSGEV